ncbi:hypothetical protein KIN20_015563 [Parelaphostrongylus tenuis]|uniref:Uncharacterized protein n=1 Tax=Parelaphostrongylus tenuis TaxID=148309 RepID=A0AAD5N4B6_PARTN|nr:hypothetical protein KIN20_015563 [Parelaphostrongylus tenuis]
MDMNGTTTAITIFFNIMLFNEIDAYAPNLSSSIIDCEVLPPPDIERIFGLAGGVRNHFMISHSHYHNVLAVFNHVDS